MGTRAGTVSIRCLYRAYPGPIAPPRSLLLSYFPGAIRACVDLRNLRCCMQSDFDYSDSDLDPHPANETPSNPEVVGVCEYGGKQCTNLRTYLRHSKGEGQCTTETRGRKRQRTAAPSSRPSQPSLDQDPDPDQGQDQGQEDLAHYK